MDDEGSTGRKNEEASPYLKRIMRKIFAFFSTKDYNFETFENLSFKHLEILRESLQILEDCIKNYDEEKINLLLKLEKEGDVVRRNLLKYLHMSNILSIEKFLLNNYAEKIDNCIDYVKDSGLLLKYLEGKEILEELEILGDVQQIIKITKSMCELTKNAFKKFLEKDSKGSLKTIEEIEKLEHEIDKIEEKVLSIVYEKLENRPTILLKMKSFVEKLCNVSDELEDANDELEKLCFII